MSEVVYRSAVRIERVKGPVRKAYLPAESEPVIFDPITGHATTMMVQVHVRVHLDERDSGKILYRNDDFLFRQEYQITSDITSFFDEQDPALDRMARDFASRLVADILENF